MRNSASMKSLWRMVLHGVGLVVEDVHPVLGRRPASPSFRIHSTVRQNRIIFHGDDHRRPVLVSLATWKTSACFVCSPRRTASFWLDRKLECALDFVGCGIGGCDPAFSKCSTSPLAVRVLRNPLILHDRNVQTSSQMIEGVIGRSGRVNS